MEASQELTEDHKRYQQLQLEQDILSLCLRKLQAVQECSDRRIPSNLFDPIHQLLYDGIVEVFRSSQGRRLLGRTTYRQYLIDRSAEGMKGNVILSLSVYDRVKVSGCGAKLDDLGILLTRLKERKAATRLQSVLGDTYERLRGTAAPPPLLDLVQDLAAA